MRRRWMQARIERKRLLRSRAISAGRYRLHENQIPTRLLRPMDVAPTSSPHADFPTGWTSHEGFETSPKPTCVKDIAPRPLPRGETHKPVSEILPIADAEVHVHPWSLLRDLLSAADFEPGRTCHPTDT